jgi:hypothetical protein
MYSIDVTFDIFDGMNHSIRSSLSVYMTVMDQNTDYIRYVIYGLYQPECIEITLTDGVNVDKH